jgi:hypothetical protein
MQNQSLAFELGIHHCLLKADWDTLKAIPSSFNMIENECIQKQMDSLNAYIEKPYNFDSEFKLKRLEKRIQDLDDYIAKERKKCRIFKDLSHLSNITVTIE